jgi:hypothetical protein
LVGEIGGNDYNYGFFQGIRSIEAMKTYVPQVIKTIMDVAKASFLVYFLLRESNSSRLCDTRSLLVYWNNGVRLVYLVRNPSSTPSMH